MANATPNNNNTPSLSSAVSLGSCIGGIPITLHWSFFLLLALEFINALIKYWRNYPIYILFVIVLYGPILLVTIVTHELGHALTTKKLGGTVGGIVLWPLGGFALCGPTEGLKGDLKVALAGPVMHIPMAFIWWCIYVGTSEDEWGLWPSSTIYLETLAGSAAGFFAMLAVQSLYLNIMLFCFNLFVPAYPLDGGRVYAASLMLVLKLKPVVAAKVTSITAMVIATGLFIYAVIGFFSPIAASSLLLGLVGIFVFYQSYELWLAIKNDDLSNHPIFGRDCYKGDPTDTTGGEEVPATSVEAEVV